jgi:hypothetical protein
MVAQFLEIYAHRHFDSNDKIHIVQKSEVINKIATQLHFVLHNGIYTRMCRI